MSIAFMLFVATSLPLVFFIAANLVSMQGLG
jgi:hypothetical protein